MAISLAIISLENPPIITRKHKIESHRNGLTIVTESFLLSVKFYSNQRDREKNSLSGFSSYTFQCNMCTFALRHIGKNLCSKFRAIITGN